MNFKEWLKMNEVGTGTNAIAGFSRPIFGSPMRRADAHDLMIGGRLAGDEGEDHPHLKRKKKKKRKHSA